MPRQTTIRQQPDITTTWRHVDASGKVLGRLATEIATVLMGKHRPDYTPHVDCGEGVVVTNAEKVAVTGRKLEQKTFQRYSGYPSGLKVQTYQTILDEHPERLIEEAVRRMLPRGRLGRKMFTKLRVYAGPTHHQTAQQPVEWKPI